MRSTVLFEHVRPPEQARPRNRLQIAPTAVVTSVVGGTVIGAACAHGNPYGIGWFALWSLMGVAVVLGSTLAHEAGHAVVALCCGLALYRVRVTGCLSATVVRQRARDAATEILVCAAGPVVSAVLTGIGLATAIAGSHGVQSLGVAVAAVNGFAVLCSLPLVPGSDGMNIRRALAGREVPAGVGATT